MIPHAPLADDRPLRRAVGADYHADETACVARLLADFRVGAAQRRRIDATARRLVQGIRAAHGGHGGLDTFLQEYKLSSDEGVALMCLAEALLRIPDAGTADALIEDKLAGADWKSHLGHSESLLVNLSTWGL
ncbi:MAG: bifunctional proline dehydrogenase/L-glutamate gamma-semialdehyde dehydrogenase, partial [bacterium]